MQTRYFEAEGNPVFKEPVDGSVVFECKSVDKWLPERLMKKVSEISTNLPVYWRHRSPQKDQYKNYPVIGRVLASRLENGEVYNTYLIYPSFHEARQAAVEWIKKRVEEGKPVGVSVGISCIQRGDEILDAEPFEYSITPYPACETCTTTEVVMMSDEKKEESSDEIQEQLDQLEEKEKLLQEEYEKKLAELEERAAKVKELEQALQEKEKVATEKEKENSALKAAIEEMEKKFKSEIERLEKKPLLEKIKELENEHVYKFFEKEYMNKSVDELKARIACLEKQKEATPPPIVTSDIEKEKEESGKLTVEDILEGVSDLQLREQLKNYFGDK